MFRLLSILLVAPLVTLLVACSSASPTAPTATPTDPVALITEAAHNIQSADTFRISVNETGPDYQVFTNYATVYFRRLIAQYVSPRTMQATIRVLAGGLPIDIQVFSQGKDQWYRAIWTANQWVNQAFAPDFNPETLIAENSGFQAALNALIDLKYVGQEQLENGTQVYHIAATANGPDVAALLGNVISPVGTVGVDVYVDTNSKYPVRFVITENDSPFAVTLEAGQTAQSFVWTIDLYDINAASQIVRPEALGAATPEVTLEPIHMETEEATAPAEAGS